MLGRQGNKALEYDVAVVGGGMVGICVSQLLSQSLPSLRLAIIDSQSLEPTQKPRNYQADVRTTAVSSQSVKILSTMGGWNELVQHSTPIAQVHVSDRGHIGSSSFSKEENDGKYLGYVLENRWVNDQLLSLISKNEAIDRLGDITVQSAQINAKGALLTVLQNGDEGPLSLSCKLLVIADGAQSRIRDQLGISCDTHDYRQSAVIANVEYERHHGGVAFERFTDEGPLALLPLGESENASLSSLVWTIPEQQIDSVMNWSDQQFLSALQARFGFRLGHFVKVSQRYSFPLKRVVAREQVRSSVVVMGNAAHFLHPVAGQGFNLALRDSAMLSRVLSEAFSEGRSIGEYKTLAKYARAQAKDQMITTHLSHQLNRSFADKRISTQAWRNISLLGLNMFLPLKKNFFGQMMGHGDLVRHLG